ncbi:MAG: hypothetical protein EA388_01150 [Nitriliruptor sp.]|nr:MAG: hypothetical protein EA388_01150 [Nitriliruptor sp.]
MAQQRQHTQSEQRSTISAWARARVGALVGSPLGLGMGIYAATSVPDQRSLGLWIAYLGGSLFAFSTFGAFVGAMSIPRRGDD